MSDDDGQLTEVLREFARALTTDFPIQGILDYLVERIVEVLPVTGAGVTLISPDLSPRYVAASNDDALEFERLQPRCGDGPCLLAYETGESVAVPDLLIDDRFPTFAPPARTAGLAAVFTFPLRHGEGCIGALDLYRNTIGPMNRHEALTAETMADVVAACLINAEAREAATDAADAHRHYSLHDPLTGLPNRTLLIERLHQAAQRAKRSNGSTAVYFVDIDRFKLVNDHHGHHVGDQLLVAIAERFVHLLRPGDTVSRISGDEFVFLCEDLGEESAAQTIESRIHAAFGRPFLVGGLRLSIVASVGVAIARAGEVVSPGLIVRADTAMYLVKRQRGGRRHVVSARDSALSTVPENLEDELREALEKDALTLAFQPIVRTSDSTIVEVEALLRWEHPERGQVAPDLMIGTAERSSLIDLIGEWMIERGCEAAADWSRGGGRSVVGIAVNVSARQLVRGDLVTTVGRSLDLAGLDPSALVLEMTENLLIEDSDRAMHVLRDLRRLGVRIALDDFGTGYSSLGYLTRLPIDILKIDRSLVAEVATEPGRAVVSAVTSLAHELGMTVVAEGIETRDQCDQVSGIGCDHAQGYYYSRPLSRTAIDALDWESPLPGGVVSGVTH